MRFNDVKTRFCFWSITSLLNIVNLKLKQNMIDVNIYYGDIEFLLVKIIISIFFFLFNLKI